MNGRQRKQAGKPAPRKARVWLWLFFGTGVCALLAMVLYLVVLLIGQRLLTDNISKLHLDVASIVYDGNGREATKIYTQNRDAVDLSKVPKLLQDGVVAVEDQRFYEHPGIDYIGVARAIVTDIVHMRKVEGGSTITQQLAKNIFLSNEKTLLRKAKEASIALALEQRYSKKEILGMYLNRINYGNGIYGVRTAAEYYFGVSDLSKLQLWQIATLVGIPKSPEHYNPLDDPERAKQREKVVLDIMREQGLITAGDEAEALTHPMKMAEGKQVQATGFKYRSYVDYVMDEAERVAGLTSDDLRRGGYKIYTTLNTTAQQAAEDAFERDSLFPEGMNGEQVQGGMAIIDHRYGSIVALAGGRDYAHGQNRALALRQPGSSFKPIAVYGPALETGDWEPYSMLKDERMSFDGYTPHNYDGKYLGEVTMTQAIKESINVSAVWLLQQIGVDRGIAFADKLGFRLDPVKDRNLAIALGGLTDGVSPLQMAAAYGAFAENGIYREPHAISRIVDSHGREIYAFQPNDRSVMSAKTAWDMTYMLQKVLDPDGTGHAAQFDRPAAGKTGTTQLDLKDAKGRALPGNRDVWFAGYTPEWSAAVWMGMDETDPQHYMRGGSSYPARMFAYVMSRAMRGISSGDFVKPDGVPDVVPTVGAVHDLRAQYSESDQGVLLDWTPQEGPVEYRIYRKSAEDADYALLLETSSTSVKDITVNPGTTYQYVVTTYVPNTGLESGKSNVAEAAVPPAEDAGLPGLGGLTGPGEGSPNPGGGAPDANAGEGDGQGGASQDGGQTQENGGAGSTGGGTAGTGSTGGGSTGAGMADGGAQGAGTGGAGTTESGTGGTGTAGSGGEAGTGTGTGTGSGSGTGTGTGGRTSQR